MKEPQVLYLLEKLEMGFSNLCKGYKRDDFLDTAYLMLLLKDLNELTNLYKHQLK